MTRQRHDSVEKSAQKIIGTVIAAVNEFLLLLRHELGCPYDYNLKFEVAIWFTDKKYFSLLNVAANSYAMGRNYSDM